MRGTNRGFVDNRSVLLFDDGGSLLAGASVDSLDVGGLTIEKSRADSTQRRIIWPAQSPAPRWK